MTENKTGDITILGPINNRIKKGPDLSVLKPPILTTITGMKQAVHSLETGSLEVKRVLLNEANLIYECKVCLGMFRSIANLVAHKRSFCAELSSNVNHKFSGEDKENQTTTVVIQAEDTLCSSDPENWNMDNYSPSMDLIRTSGIINDILSAPLVNKLKPEKPRDLKSVASYLTAVASEDPNSVYRTKKPNVTEEPKERKVLLEPIYNTKNALYQTWKVSEGQESVKAMNGKLNQQKLVDNHIVIRFDDDEGEKVEPNQKPLTQIVPKNDEPTEKLIQRLPCLFCKAHFTSWKSAKKHMAQFHDKTPEFVQSKRDAVFSLAFEGPTGVWHVIDKQANSPVPLNPKLSDIPDTKPKMENIGIPVKSVSVGIKKLNLDKEDICRLVGTDQVCPMLKTKIGPGQVLDQTSIMEHTKELENIPEEVDRKIMEHINRRHLQCKICYKRFRGTFLAKQHVATTHLKFHRYKCSVCDYGAWSKEHVLSHASKNHRTRNSHDFAIEQPKEVYFSKYMEPSQTVVPAISGTLLNHNFEDFKIDSAVPKTYKCGVNLENGGVHHGDQADMVPASLIAGLKYQNISDSSDSEVSFNKRVVGKRRRHSSEGSDDKPRAKTNKSDDTKGYESPTPSSPNSSLISKMKMQLSSLFGAKEILDTNCQDKIECKNESQIQSKRSFRQPKISMNGDFSGYERKSRGPRNKRASSELR